MLAAFLRACTFPSIRSSNESACLGSAGSRVDVGILVGSETDSDIILDWDLQFPGLLLADAVSAALAKSASSSAIGRVGKNGVACKLKLNDVTASLSFTSGDSFCHSGCPLQEVLLLACVFSPLFVVLFK